MERRIQTIRSIIKSEEKAGNYMIQKISHLLSVFTANNLHISKKDERIMQYCFEQVLCYDIWYKLDNWRIAK